MGEIPKGQDLIPFLIRWLGTSCLRSSDKALWSFLTRLDQFDLYEFMHNLCFEEMKISEVPVQKPLTKSCRGVPEMVRAFEEFMPYSF